MSDKQLFPKPSGPKSLRPKNIDPVGGILITLVVAVVSGLIGKACVKAMYSSKRATIVSGPTWKEPTWSRYSPAGLQMSVELPGKPKPEHGEPPPELKEIMASFVVYEVLEGGISIGLGRLEYVELNLKLNTERAAMGTLEGLRNESGVTALDYKIVNLSETESSYTGNLTRNGRVSDVNGFVRVKGRRIWTVYCISIRGDSWAKAAADRVLQSAKVD